MTQSIATLGIRVTQQGVAEAERDLSNLATSGARVEQQAARTANGMQRQAMSAAQLRAATRGLPAQFTDIATALGSGQRPLQVLLQQGGQLRDMFGGIGPAIRAMGGYVLGLVNPVTLVAGAIGVLGYAWYQAADRAEQFNKALILTGNYAAESADDLARLAEKLDATTSATTGRASEVLAQVAGSGKFTADQLELVTHAALQMEDATGKAIEDTVAEFAALKGDPVAAILKLNDTQHFLTEATLDQIESLKEQGREADAAGVAMRAYADVIDQRAPQAVENLGLIATAWRGIKQGSKEAWDEVVNGFGRADVAAKEGLQSLSNYLNAFRNGPAGLFTLQSSANFSASPSSVASPPAKTVDSNSERARMEAAKEFARIELSNLDRRQRLEREIAEIRKVGIAAGKTEAQISAQITAARARYAESLPKGRKPRQQSDASIQSARDRFNDMVGRFKAELEGPLERVEQNHLRNLREINQAAIAGKVSHGELANALDVEAQAYAKASKEVQNRLDAEIASLSGPVAQAQNEHEAALRRIEELRKQGAITGVQYNAMLAEESRVFGQAAKAARRAADPIGALLEDMEFELHLLRLSNPEREREIALRHAGAEATEEQRLRIVDLLDELRNARELDAFKGDLKTLFVDIGMNVGHAEDALENFFDTLKRRALEALAENLIGQLFGEKKSDGSGGGGWLASIGTAIAGLFGGGRAIGGPVSGGRIYEVAEGGRPELLMQGGKTYLIPGSNGRVVPPSSGGGGAPAAAASPGVEVKIINNSGAPARAQESTGADGRKLLEVIIGEVDRRISTNGSTGKAIGQRFGLAPVGVSRG